MDKNLLVSLDLEAAGKAFDAILAAGIRVDVAVMAYLPEFEDWRLVLAARDLDKLGQEGHTGVSSRVCVLLA